MQRNFEKDLNEIERNDTSLNVEEAFRETLSNSGFQNVSKEYVNQIRDGDQEMENGQDNDASKSSFDDSNIGSPFCDVNIRLRDNDENN